MILDDLNLTMPNEIGGIWMKHIRNILLLITIIFAFVMQAEVYQNMLWNFNGDRKSTRLNSSHAT